MRRTALLLLFLANTLPAKEPPAADKSQYSLFHPTPREFMRELSTDRPDTTESAYTVDAGHLQIEMDIVSYTRDRHTPERDGGSESWAFATSNVKLGLTNSLDFQLVIPVHQRISGGRSGFGDLTFRLKKNIWGNDSGNTALAVMPYIKVPTGTDELGGNDEVEGGLIIPFAAALPADWGFGAQIEIANFADDDGSGRHFEFLASVTVSHAIVGELGGFIEFVSVAGPETDWLASFNAGLTYGATPDLQLDAGINIGLTRATEDLTAFLGMSIRF